MDISEDGAPQRVMLRVGRIFPNAWWRVGGVNGWVSVMKGGGRWAEDRKGGRTEGTRGGMGLKGTAGYHVVICRCVTP